MKLALLGVAVAIGVFGGDAAAAPRDDLASPSQAVRDAAAETLRRTYKPAPRKRFVRLLRAINRKGMTKPKVVALLRPYKPTMEGAGASGGGETVNYRIDDAWILQAAFSTRGDATAFGAELIESVHRIWVEPPAGFTGVWVTYYVNGHKASSITYKAGKQDGPLLSFHDNGARATMQTYGPTGAHGEDIGYHRSGKLAYRGMYRDNRQVGTWTWYDEAGNVTSTRQY